MEPEPELVPVQERWLVQAVGPVLRWVPQPERLSPALEVVRVPEHLPVEVVRAPASLGEGQQGLSQHSFLHLPGSQEHPDRMGLAKPGEMLAE